MIMYKYSKTLQYLENRKQNLLSQKIYNIYIVEDL